VLQWYEHLSFEGAREPRLHMDCGHMSSLWMPPSIKGGVAMTVVALHRWTFLLKVMLLPNILLDAISDSDKSLFDI